MYIAIIADLIKSREMKNREQVQIEINQVLDQTNEIFEQSIAAKFIITIGDEFQGLLKNADQLETIIDYLKFKLQPYKIRIGIGMGDLSTLLSQEYAIGADGPVYHRAREGVELLKVNAKKNSIASNDTMFAYTSTGNTSIETLLNTSFASCYYIESSWTKKQRETVEKLIVDKMTQQEVAEYFAIDQSNVSRRLNAAGYYTYLQAKSSVYNHIKTLWEEHEDFS